jgi:hypothetical protein
MEGGAFQVLIIDAIIRFPNHRVHRDGEDHAARDARVSAMRINRTL